MYKKKPQSNARKVWGIVLIVYACIGLVFMPSVYSRMQTRFNPVMLLPYALILLVGILLLPKKPKGLGDFWRTDDPNQAQKVIRKLDRVKKDSDLMNIGRNAPLQEVARAAFGRVSSQKDLAFFVRSGSDRDRARIALEYVNDDVELKEIALKCKEPISSAALERMRSEKMIAEVASSPASPLAAKALERLTDAGELTKLADDGNAPEGVRRKAYEKLGKPILADGVVLASESAGEADKQRATECILETKDPGLIARVAEMLCKAPKAPDHYGREFLAKAASAWPDALLPLGNKSWSNGCGDIIRASAWDAQGRAVQADQLRLSSKVFNRVEKQRAGKRLLQAGDEAVIRQSVEQVLRGPQDAGSKEFVLDVATAFPGIIQQLWPKVREWGHVSTSDHTDYTRNAPHVDSTRYYDFYRYPDGRTVPKRDGRKTHTDGPMPSSDCAEYGHTDRSTHTDNAELLEKGYHALFPKAVKGGE